MTPSTMVQAINQALREEMSRDHRVILLGEDVAREGGIFRVTAGLLKAFGEERVFDTPVSESGIIGVSLGLAISGLRPVPELQFSGFSYYAFHQIESHVSRYRRRSQGRFPCPMVIRMPYGAGVRALEHHSESREAYYAHTPGLTVVIPRSPRRARALLKSCIRSPDPVIFMEPKALYRSVREEIPEEEELAPLGSAEVVREGRHITVVSYGHMLHRSAQALDHLAKKGVEGELIDLQTIAPLDGDTVIQSVKKTGRLVVVQEAASSFGPAAEVMARVCEEALEYLEAAPKRVSGFDVPVPLYAREEAYLPASADIAHAIEDVLEH